MKKVLIITYYWPPAGGPGVQRVLKFAKYLPEFGWEPVILTVENGEYPAIDESLVSDIPSGLKVIRTKTVEPYTLYRLLNGQGKKNRIPSYVLSESGNGGFKKRISRYIRGNLFIPDAKIGWIPFAVREGMRILRNEQIDLIFSSSPPQTVNLVARKLAQKSGVRWVADFRDPWTDIFYYHTMHRIPLAANLDRALEERVLRNATAVITVSPSIVRLLEKKVKNQYFVLPNGFDDSDFGRAGSLEPDENFTLLHTGHLAATQNPVVLWEALAVLVESADGFRNSLQIHFYGNVQPEVIQSLESHGLRDYCTFYDYTPHAEIVNVMQKSSLLFFVVPQCDHNEGILTSKLFDYFGAQRPILGIGPRKGDAAAILKETKAGAMFEYADSDGVTGFVRDLFNAWKKHGITSLEDVDATARYSRRNLTRRLSQIFSSVSDL